MLRLSIIIPAYKVEDYIEKCIRSLEDQDISKSEYEIIVVNDGSPDNCKEVVEMLQKEFSNIILINQENQGVSVARNNAIAIAKGNFILPIDPDDYVLPNTFKNILALAEEQHLDLLYLGFEIFDATGKSTWKTNYSKQESTIYTGVDGYFSSRGFDVRDPDRSWAILYRSDMLQLFKIKYPKDVPYLEDGLFLAKVFAVANRVTFHNAIFYQRTTRKGSATNSRLFYSEKAIQGFIYAVQDIKNFGNQKKIKGEQAGLINHVVAKFVILSLSSSILMLDFRTYFKTIKVFNNQNLETLPTKGLRLSYAKYIKVYNFSKILFLIYFRFVNLNLYLKLKKWSRFFEIE